MELVVEQGLCAGDTTTSPRLAVKQTVQEEPPTISGALRMSKDSGGQQFQYSEQTVEGGHGNASGP